MQGLINFFSSIVEGIKIAFDFLFDMIKDLVYVVKLLGSFIAKIPSLFAWLPAGVLALIVTIFGIVLIYKIIGREG